MREIIFFFYCLVLCLNAWGGAIPGESISGAKCPLVALTFPPNIPKTMYNYETIRIPMHMHYEHLRWHKVWGFNQVGGANIYMQLENAAGKCPNLVNDVLTWHSGECDMYIVISGKGINNTMQAYVTYNIFGELKVAYHSPLYAIKIIPRPLSMVSVQPQKATIGQKFTYPLNRAILNYGESMEANLKVNLEMTLDEQKRLNALDLYYNPTNFSLTGVPNQAGDFAFKLGASNYYGKAAPATLLISVGFNPNDKPVFKTSPIIYNAFRAQDYKLYLLDLLEKKKGFAQTNQITFRFAEKTSHPDWLRISKDYPPILEGIPRSNLAGQIIEVTVIAASNTGGDSEPYTIKIPIVYDESKKPSIRPSMREQEADTDFFLDLSSEVINPAEGSKFEIKIDQIKPAADWLRVSSSNPQIMEGRIPTSAVGMRYEITLHVHTDIGGNSDVVTIPLQIKPDAKHKPMFKKSVFDLPLLYPGQGYVYDFVANKEVSPEYEDIPYIIQFAPESAHPAWLKIENNQLVTDKVPENIAEEKIPVEIVISNIPGGTSDLYTFALHVAK